MPIKPPGKIFHAKAQPDLGKTRPAFAFVPDSLISEGNLDARAYSAQRWDSINCAANAYAVGSHIFPDLTRPADPSECPEFLASLARYLHKHKGKPSPPKLPGKAEPELN